MIYGQGSCGSLHEHNTACTLPFSDLSRALPQTFQCSPPASSSRPGAAPLDKGQRENEDRSMTYALTPPPVNMYSVCMGVCVGGEEGEFFKSSF